MLLAVVLSLAVHAKEAAGHWRLDSPQGAVHVFRPAGYEKKKGGVVLYVHGLFDGIDDAWEKHDLPWQFQESNRNAIFIAPEAPIKATDLTRWNELDELLELVKKRLPRLKIEDEPIVAVGHSGAYRTIVNWLSHPRIREVFLVDGLYGNEDDYAAWLDRDKSHRMVMTVLTTAKWAEPFVARYPDSVRVDIIPKWAWPEHVKAARLVHIWSDKFGHMEQITQKRVLPVLMRLSTLKRRWEPPAK